MSVMLVCVSVCFHAVRSEGRYEIREYLFEFFELVVNKYMDMFDITYSWTCTSVCFMNFSVNMELPATNELL